MADETMMPQWAKNQNLPQNLKDALMNTDMQNDGDYDSSALEHVIEASGAKNWNDIRDYLANKGADDDELMPEEAARMYLDADKIKGQELPQDPEEAVKMAKENR